MFKNLFNKKNEQYNKLNTSTDETVIDESEYFYRDNEMMRAEIDSNIKVNENKKIKK